MIFHQKPDGGCSTTVPRSCTCGLSRSLTGSCGLCRRASWTRFYFVLFEPVLWLLGIFVSSIGPCSCDFCIIGVHCCSRLRMAVASGIFREEWYWYLCDFSSSILQFFLSSAHVRRGRSRSRYLVLIVGCPMPKSLRHFSIGSPVNSRFCKYREKPGGSRAIFVCRRQRDSNP